MMAAAQAAAETALREAAAWDRRTQKQSTDDQAVAELLQGALQDDYQQETAAQHLLNEIMGQQREATVDSSMESILRMMAQHHQAVPPPVMQPQVPERPPKHYMTVAGDGEFI
jgi:hypothetical protein